MINQDPRTFERKMIEWRKGNSDIYYSGESICYDGKGPKRSRRDIRNSPVTEQWRKDSQLFNHNTISRILLNWDLKDLITVYDIGDHVRLIRVRLKLLSKLIKQSSFRDPSLCFDNDRIHELILDVESKQRFKCKYVKVEAKSSLMRDFTVSTTYYYRRCLILMDYRIDGKRINNTFRPRPVRCSSKNLIYSCCQCLSTSIGTSRGIQFELCMMCYSEICSECMVFKNLCYNCVKFCPECVNFSIISRMEDTKAINNTAFTIIKNMLLDNPLTFKLSQLLTAPQSKVWIKLPSCYFADSTIASVFKFSTRYSDKNDVCQVQTCPSCFEKMCSDLFSEKSAVERNYSLSVLYKDIASDVVWRLIGSFVYGDELKSLVKGKGPQGFKHITSDMLIEHAHVVNLARDILYEADFQRWNISLLNTAQFTFNPLISYHHVCIDIPGVSPFVDCFLKFSRYLMRGSSDAECYGRSKRKVFSRQQVLDASRYFFMEHKELLLPFEEKLTDLYGFQKESIRNKTTRAKIGKDSYLYIPHTEKERVELIRLLQGNDYIEMHDGEEEEKGTLLPLAKNSSFNKTTLKQEGFVLLGRKNSVFKDSNYHLNIREAFKSINRYQKIKEDSSSQRIDYRNDFSDVD